MALAAPPPNDKKRVKVYELRNNDWFDRGTGFCTGRVINVRESRTPKAVRGHSVLVNPKRLRAPCMNIADQGNRMNQRSTSSQKISQSVCSWKLRSRKMMDTKSNRVIVIISAR
jgi:hypothetical protein